MVRLRIVHLIDYMGLGGAEMMLYRLLTKMNATRFENGVISLMDLGTIGRQVETLGLPLHVLGMRRGCPNPIFYFRLVRLLRRLKPDILQTWMVNADLAGLLAGRMAGIKRISWNLRGSNIRPGESSKLTRLAKHACAHLSGWPTVVIANASAGRRAHEAMGYHPGNWRIIPNGFELEVFKPDPLARDSVRKEMGVPGEAPLIGIVGRHHPVKDQVNFIKAAERLHKTRPEIHFAMIGEGLTLYNRELGRAAPGFFASDVLHLLGMRRDIPRLMAALDVFTLTSLSEGFPNVVGEAMACGVPCVVTETAGDAPVIVGETGMVVPARDPHALAAAWGKLLDLPKADRLEMGKAGRKRIREHYAIAEIVQRYERLYDSLMRD